MYNGYICIILYFLNSNVCGVITLDLIVHRERERERDGGGQAKTMLRAWTKLFHMMLITLIRGRWYSIHCIEKRNQAHISLLNDLSLRMRSKNEHK